MNPSTHSLRFVAAVVGAAALTLSVPVAGAQTPDVIERAAQSHLSMSRTFVGSPDAIDRALAAHQAQARLAALDVRERSLSERPRTASGITAPDATERPTDLSPVSASGVDGFDWGDFGMGAGAGIGLVLVAGLGGLLIRRGQEGLTTA